MKSFKLELHLLTLIYRQFVITYRLDAFLVVDSHSCLRPNKPSHWTSSSGEAAVGLPFSVREKQRYNKYTNFNA